jgi:small-conductance mechanosensitive channel
MVAADLVRVCAMGGAAAAFFAGAPAEVIYALAVVTALAGTAFPPAQAALLPALARSPEELTAANATTTTIESVAVFAGPALGGVLYAVVGGVGLLVGMEIPLVLRILRERIEFKDLVSYVLTFDYVGALAVLFLVFLGLWFLLSAGIISMPSQRVADILRRGSLGLAAIFLVLVAERLAESYFVPRLDNTVARYNLRRVLHLLVGLAVALILVTAIFVNWYTAVVSFGLISLILGFALQTPITSFIGWIYILVRKPYRVGDRIMIGNAKGDVIDVSYLDTTLWEFGGQYLSTDHPSGRIIKFPNAQVLTNPVYNYSWPLFPYIWNEIRFQIAYDSDLEFVGKTMSEVAADELGETMMERVKVYRELLAETPVDELENLDTTVWW